MFMKLRYTPFDDGYCNKVLRPHTLGRWRTEGEGVRGVQTPTPKFRTLDKAEPNFQFHGKYIRNNLTKIQVSLSCKLSGTPD
jgi:hypothetical protein